MTEPQETNRPASQDRQFNPQKPPRDGRPVVFLVNEFGNGFGHARRLLTVAERLADQAYPVLFVPNPGLPLLAACPFPCLTTPPKPIPSRPPPASFGLADVLTLAGYTTPNALRSLLSGWDERMARWSPALFIGDSAPSARLASLGRAPFLAMGDGYVLPPAHLSLTRRADGEVLETDEEILARIAAAQAQRGGPAPTNLTSLWCGSLDVVCTHPFLDPFSAQRRYPACGPLLLPPPPASPSEQPGIFAYLASTKKGKATFDALSMVKLPTRVYVRDASWPVPPGASHMNVLKNPGVMRDEATRASLVVHHGGNGTAETLVALGRPQLLVPNHLEQHLTARSLSRCGIARVSHSWKDPAVLAQDIVAAAMDPSLAKAAQSFAHTLPKTEPSVDVIHREALAMIRAGQALA